MKKLLALAIILVASVAHGQTLRSLATARGFTIGCGDTDPSIFNTDATFNNLVATQCNSIEPGNVMKQNAIEPSQCFSSDPTSCYVWTNADAVMNYAATNSQTVTATAPVWDGHPGGPPNSYCGNCGNPSWLASGGYNASQMTTILQNYVAAFMTHMHTNYPGRMKQIALVSEASHTCPNGSYNPGYGVGTMCGTIGPDTASGAYASHVSGLTYFPEYVTLAYTQARATDPTAQLCYDDWGWEGSGTGSNYQYWQVAYLKSRGLVDCVGLEGQWQYAAIPTNVPSTGSISSMMSAYQSLGVTVYLSQVELGIHTNGTNNTVPNSYTSTVPADLTTQANLYSALVNACLGNAACNAFYVWGIGDKWAFIDAPSPYGVGAPQLYDASYNPKAAYTAVQTALAGGGGSTYTLSTATNGTGSGTLVCTPHGSGISAGTGYSCISTAAGGSVLAGVSGCGGTGTSTFVGNMPASNCTVTATFNSGSCNASATASTADPNTWQAAASTLSCPTSTLTVPSGTATQTAGATLTVPGTVTNLTIQGATVVSCTGTQGQSGYACPSTDSTVIIDSYVSNNPLLTLNLSSSPSAVFRLTGITVKGGNAGSGGSKYNGWILVNSGVSQVRIDHNHFNEVTYSPAITGVVFRNFTPITGVADHNLLDLSATNSGYPFGFSDFGAYGDTIGNGDGAFNLPTAWGQLTPFYVESNVQNGGVINDCGNGGTMVIRYNNINDASVAIQTHGTKSPAGPARGCRSIEMYGNYFTGPGGGAQQSAAVGTKGTAALIWGNNMASGFYRFYQGGGDRQSGDEVETNTPNGWGYCGTAVNGNGVGSLWDGNQGGGGAATASGYPCLDGLGRGQTPQSLNGANFPGRLNSSTGTIAWPKQYLEPQYLWLNTLYSGASAYMLLNDGSANNQDYFYDCGTWNSSCSSFTGAAGTGSGLLSARPATCTAGAGGTYLTSPTGSYGPAYWATDANGGRGELYVCDSTNHWVGIYEPAVYPHPLVGGAPAQVATPALSPTTGAPPQTVTLSVSTGGAAICYTTDGSTPTAPMAGTCSGGTTAKYSTPLSITVNPTTVNAIGTLVGYTNSSLASSTYSGSAPVCADPTQQGPPTYPGQSYSNTYSSAVSAGFTSPTAGCIMHITMDGSTPTSASPVYAGPYTISSTTTLRTIAIQAGYTNSGIAGGTWTITAGQAATPVITPATGTYTTAQSVLIACSSPTPTIYYTIDGTTPTTGSTVYGGTFVRSVTTNVQAICASAGLTQSAVAQSIITINVPQAVAPTFSPSSPYSGPATTVTLSSTTPSPTISYCQDVTNTCTPSTVGSSVSFTTTGFIRAFTNASGYTQSPISSWSGTLVATPTPTAAISLTLTPGDKLQ